MQFIYFSNYHDMSSKKGNLPISFFAEHNLDFNCLYMIVICVERNIITFSVLGHLKNFP